VVDQWRVQVSLAFAILLVVAVFAFMYVLIRVLTWLAQMPARYRGWQGQRQEKREQSLLEQGWTALLEGRYAHAEKTLTRLSGQSSDKRRQVLAMLSAARAAHEVGEYKRQDELLAQAQAAAASQSSDIDLNTAVAATAADLWLEQGRAEEALGALQVDHVQPMRHLHTMRLMLRVYQQTQNHAKVLELARALRRKDAISQAEANKLIESAAAAMIRAAQAQNLGAGGEKQPGKLGDPQADRQTNWQIDRQPDSQNGIQTARATNRETTIETTRQTNQKGTSPSWEACWKELKSEEKVLPEVALAGSQAFQTAGNYKEATKVLEAAITSTHEKVKSDKARSDKAESENTADNRLAPQLVPLDAKLLAAYARAEPEQVTPRLQKAEQWLEERKAVQKKSGAPVSPAVNADLLTTLGALCLAAQMWGQAQRYLEQSAKLRKDARVHALLGSLFDRIGQPQRAAQHWRLATAVSAALPTLAQDVVLPAANTEADPIIPHGEGLGACDEGQVETIEADADQQPVTTATNPAGYDEFFDSAPIPMGHFESIDEQVGAKAHKEDR